MAPKAIEDKDITSNLTKLSLKTTELETAKPTSRAKPQKKGSPVADSWEDEADDDDEQAADAEETPTATPRQAGTSAPPPTPMSPVASNKRPFSPSALSGPGFSIPPFDGPGDSLGESTTTGPTKRPEKTDAVARRMIASALGMRAPKLTEEQKAYDRAVREKERKRLEQEKEEKRKREEEIAKARQAIWED
ncbi:coiled-coil domain-containing protein R3HCC1L [Achaetomium macrosporum]|uniref:Coiled-coil domain-containing protein R3HCC1L n=1 Tax=Achaetomium macrosporum TaxID=79813 RepID=A0AAN7H790_9PEZI|nr:coiled-coil domain-containing protein R3HCC1L [Achaetomium macrosporum]